MNNSQYIILFEELVEDKKVPLSIMDQFGSCDHPIANLHDNKWNLWRVNEIVKNFQSWDVECLWIFKNNKPDILKEIQHITFGNLKWLSFSNNNIESLDVLTKINAFSLKGIYLLQNYIVRVSPMRKCCFTLEKIGLSNNSIVDMEKLSQCRMSKKLQFLQIKNYCGYPNAISPGLFSLVKIEANEIIEEIQSENIKLQQLLEQKKQADGYQTNY